MPNSLEILQIFTANIHGEGIKRTKEQNTHLFFFLLGAEKTIRMQKIFILEIEMSQVCACIFTTGDIVEILIQAKSQIKQFPRRKIREN